MVQHFDPALFDGVVLDEASILKQSDGKTRTMLIEHFATVPYRLACTATPAPNDPEELTNQAEFLGLMTRANMLAAYFVHDDDGLAAEGPRRGPMFRWMASWAVALRRPSDLGYPDERLRPARARDHAAPPARRPRGRGPVVRHRPRRGRRPGAVRSDTLTAACERAAELVAPSPTSRGCCGAG